MTFPLAWILLEKSQIMTTHSSFLAWKIPWAEEPGGLQSMGSQSRTQLSMHAVIPRISGWFLIRAPLGKILFYAELSHDGSIIPTLKMKRLRPKRSHVPVVR